MIKQVAERLGPLRPKVVFLGGSAAGFHMNDKAEPEKRANCGCEMLLRTAKHGSYASQKFWGRSDFPRCRSIIKYSGE